MYFRPGKVLEQKMQGGRGGRQGLFGDPFAGFGGFGQPGSLMPGFFGGANPFDDPFFTNPFGSMMQPSFSTPFSGMMQPSFMNPFGSMMQPSLLGPSMFAPHGNLNGGMFGSQTHLSQGMSNASGFIQQAPEPSRPKGPIIKELSSDDEDDADDDKEDEKKNGNFRKHPRESKEPYVEDPDEEVEGQFLPSWACYCSLFRFALSYNLNLHFLILSCALYHISVLFVTQGLKYFLAILGNIRK